MSRTEDWARFLEKNLKSDSYRERTNAHIDQCVELIRNGLDLNEIQKHLKLGKKEAEIIFELAHSRINIRNKFKLWNRLWMDQYLSRYSTPEIVCRYRSERIVGYNIIEAGTGAGMQGIFLSETNESTLSVEIMPERHRMARLNAEEYGAKKIKFVQGDIYSLSPDMAIDDNTVIFCDPARPPAEGERTLETLIPSPQSLVRIFGDRTSNFVFDLPPQIKWDMIGIDGEKEYISVNGNLNRLTLYCGKLRKTETSAVLLPERIRLSGKPKDSIFPEFPEVQSYLIIPDVAIIYARLAWVLEANHGVKPCWKDNRRHIYTSGNAIRNFPGEQYQILERCGESEILQNLEKHDSGRVFLRYNIEDDRYYDVKSQLEKQLHGKLDVYIFRHGEEYFLTEKL